MGRYAEAVAANERAIAADEKYFSLAPKPDFYSLYYLHNVHFLSYAAMMEGRYETALAAARKIEETIPPDFLKNYVTMADGFTSTALFVMIRFGKWNEILEEPAPEEWRILSRAERHFARSVALSALGRTDEARKEIELLDAEAAKLTDDWVMGNNGGKEVVAIGRKMAEGELAFREGRTDAAFELLRDAVALEEGTHIRLSLPAGCNRCGMPWERCCWRTVETRRRKRSIAPIWCVIRTTHGRCSDCSNRWRSRGSSMRPRALTTKVQEAWARADVKPVASCYCHPDARGN